MKEERTCQEKLHARQLHIPSGVLYTILMPVVKILNTIANTHFTYKAYPGKDNDPYILISNHASRNDYMFTAPVCLPKKLNYVVGYNEFFRFPLGIILRLMQAIPKKNFTPDVYTIKQIMRIIRMGGRVCIMPEGMSSITGMCQPVIPGGAKMLKKLGVTVYYTKISGGYMTFTKHCLDQRNGRIDVVVDKMFTPDDLKQLSEQEIEDTMNRLLAHDDYIWNREEQVSFGKDADMAKNLDTLLYRCPKCDSVYRMKAGDNRITCLDCGNTVLIDSKYNIKSLNSVSVCPELVTDWTILEREKAAAMVAKEDFSISDNVSIGKIPEYHWLRGDLTSEICGKGTLTLDRDGLHFVGEKDGKDYSFDLAPAQVPTYGMCTDISRLYTFVEGEFIEFYFEKNQVLLWDHLTEELHRYTGGKWQNTEYRHTV